MAFIWDQQSRKTLNKVSIFIIDMFNTIKDETREKVSADQVEETLRNMEGVDSMKRAKVKMEEVREENARLKFRLFHMMKDYESLKKQFNCKMKEDDDQFKIATDLAPLPAAAFDNDESELVSLSLGRFSGDNSMREKKKANAGIWNILSKSNEAVSMNLKSGNRRDESKEEGKNDAGSSRTSPKTSRSGDDHDNETLQHYPALKKPRVSVRAVCNTQTMHDGCQWRKYGQKISKGNPCPRAYYRCTVSSSCPVRKQVQRCINDMRVLTTTYEGTHNHALPPSAASMVSATTAAAAMLNCGSTTSTSSPRPTNAFPNSSYTISSSSQSHPTVILDLTAPNHTNKFSSSPLFSAPTSLNFSSSNLNNALQTPYSQPASFFNDQKIATATKDPTFQSALAAALTSFVGRNSGLNFNLDFSQQSTSNGSIGCATSFFNRFPQSVISQPTLDFAPLTLSTSQSQARNKNKF